MAIQESGVENIVRPSVLHPEAAAFRAHLLTSAADVFRRKDTRLADESMKTLENWEERYGIAFPGFVRKYVEVSSKLSGIMARLVDVAMDTIPPLSGVSSHEALIAMAKRQGGMDKIDNLLIKQLAHIWGNKTPQETV